MRAPLAIAATMGVALALFLPTAASAQGGGEWIKFVFTPQAGSSSVCLTCGWHSVCEDPYPWGPALDFVGGDCPGSEHTVYFRNFAFVAPRAPQAYVGYAQAQEVSGTPCKTVKVSIWDTAASPLGEMRYVHTYRTYPEIIWLYANENGYENEQPVAQMVDADNPGCPGWVEIEPGVWYWPPHLHEYHIDGTSTFFLRNDGDCGATCQERYLCGWPANCLYDPQDWSNDWVRAFCIDDTDCDGWMEDEEIYLGTDPLDNCPNNPSHDAWPLDNNVDTYVTVAGDVLAYRGRLGAHGGPPSDPNWWQRVDLNADNYITVGGDALLYRGMIGTVCTNS
jgi:hypothetical protein